MRRFFWGPLVGLVTLLIYIVNLFLWVSILAIVSFIRWVVPIASWRRVWGRLKNRLPEDFCASHRWIIRLTTGTKIEVRGAENLRPDQWYVMFANHRSWADIVILQAAFSRRTPMLKFFLKQSLLWVPFVGLACWLLGFPFVRRPTKSQLKKNAALREHDKTAAQKALTGFLERPTTAFNFAEGTRFTSEKHTRQKSPYRYLLRPKSGGIGLSIAALKEKLTAVLDVTLICPGMELTAWRFLSGQVRHIIVDVQVLSVDDVLVGDFSRDADFRVSFQKWLAHRWEQKDQRIQTALDNFSGESTTTLSSKRSSKLLRIATRQSPLAMVQANFIKHQLQTQNPAQSIELIPMVTEGDRQLSAPLASAGGKGLFLKELEHALLKEEADLAVHSLKDVPVELPPGLILTAYGRREDPRDVLVTREKGSNLSDLPAGSRVGTSSLRRQCLIRHFYPHLTVEVLRGNLQTRMKRLEAGDFDAIILAAAGLHRLKQEDCISAYLPVEEFIPAVGQGVLAIECRESDVALREHLQCLHDPETAACVVAERALNHQLQGGCQVPIGAHAQLKGDELSLIACVGSPDGREFLRAEGRASLAEAEALGRTVAEDLLQQGAGAILKKVYEG